MAVSVLPSCSNRGAFLGRKTGLSDDNDIVEAKFLSSVGWFTNDDDVGEDIPGSDNVGRLLYLIENRSTALPARQNEISWNRRRSMKSCLEGTDRLIEWTVQQEKMPGVSLITRMIQYV